VTTAGPPRRVLRELGDIVDPAHTALVVVGVQNDFCHRDGGLAQGGGDMSAIEKAVEKLDDIIHAARGAGVPIIFLRIVQSPEGRVDRAVARGQEIEPAFRLDHR
jgi:nicotinamidase-related amidase